MSLVRLDCYVEVVVVAACGCGGVVHTAAVVRSPSLTVASDAPDQPLPDQILDIERGGVLLEP